MSAAVEGALQYIFECRSIIHLVMAGKAWCVIGGLIYKRLTPLCHESLGLALLE
jgi:hypothetical protein